MFGRRPGRPWPTNCFVLPWSCRGLAVCLLAACGGGGGDGSTGPVTPPPPATPVVTASTSALELLGVGATGTVTATVSPAAATLSWRSESPGVATVVASGGSATVTAVAGGTAVVVAEAVNGAQRGEARITVTVRPVVRSVVVTPSAATVQVGAQVTLAAAVTADAGADVRVEWRSAAPAVAAVDSAGVVRGVSPGVAAVIATSRGTPALADTTPVTVTAVPVVRGVVVTPGSDTVVVGGTRPLAAVVDADSGLSRAVAWRSSAPAVATVDSTGRVRGVAVGSATITALSVADTTRRGSAAVTVRAPTVQRVQLSLARTTLTVTDTTRATVVVTADSGVGTGVGYFAEPAAVAMVSANGLVTAVGPGTARVYAYSLVVPEVLDSAAITVSAPPVPTRWVDTYDGRLGAWQAALHIAALATRVTSNMVVGVGGTPGAGRVYEEDAAGTWRELSIPAGARLRAVATSAAGAWAVGDNGRIVREVGGSWADESSGTTRALTQVAMRDDGSGVAVGERGLLLERRDGAWQVLNDSAAGGSNLTHVGAVAVAPTGRTVYMTWRRRAPFTGTDMLRFDGTGWSAMAPTHVPANPTDPSGNGASNIVVTGSGDVLVAGAETSAFRWYLSRLSGATWTREFTDPISTSANSARVVGCRDGSVLVNASLSRVFERTGAGALVERFGAGGQRSPGGALACRSSTDWTVHLSSSFSGYGLWRLTSTEVRAASYLANHARVSVGGSTAAWAGTPSASQALRWNGSTWTAVPLRDAATFGSDGPGLVVATTGDALVTLLRLTGVFGGGGVTWTSGLHNFTRVWGSGLTDAWGAGPDNSFDAQYGLQRWNGSSWSNAALPVGTTTWDFVHVHGSSATNVMAVAGFPVNRAVVRWNGSAFAVDTIPVLAFESLSRVAVVSPADAVVVGSRSSARWTGTGWAPLDVLPAAPSGSFTAVAGRPGEYYAFTSDRGVHALLGTRWVRVGTTPQVVRDAVMLGPTAIAVGDSGYVAYGVPAGAATHRRR